GTPRRGGSEVPFRPRPLRRRGLHDLLAHAPLHTRRAALPRRPARGEPHERGRARARPAATPADERAGRETRPLRRLRNLDARLARRHAARHRRQLLLTLLPRTRRRLAAQSPQISLLIEG